VIRSGSSPRLPGDRLRPSLLALVLLGLLPPPAAARVLLHAGPESLQPQRWRALVALADNPGAEPRQAVLTLQRRSGRTEVHAWPVAAFAATRQEAYTYVDHPDPVITAALVLGAERTTWEAPAGIPPARVLLVVAEEPGWPARLAAALDEPEVEVAARPPEALPERWMGLRELAGIAVPAATAARLGPAQRQALDRYVLHGGLLLLLRQRPSDPFPADWPADRARGEHGQGRILDWDPQQGPLPPLAGKVRPPARVKLGTSPLDALPPLGWLGARWGAWIALLLVVAATIRRWPRASALLGALVAGALVVAPPDPAAAVPPRQSAGWTESPATDLAAGGPSRWRELQVVPERSGSTRLLLPAGPDVALVGRRPRPPLALEWNPGPGGWRIEGRWGEPVELLLESHAGDH